MLLSGSRGAPYTCLRCQLRQVVFQSRRRCLDRTDGAPARYISATHRRQDQEDDTTLADPPPRNDRPYVYRHPLGRIVGAPGRRQRLGSQKLNIDAMKKPFEVIVMQDVREPNRERSVLKKIQDGSVVNVAQIEHEMATEGQDPSQDEVNEFISALRPETRLLDEQEFNNLSKGLSEGFTTQQLNNYFIQSLNLSAVPSDTVHLIRDIPTEGKVHYPRAHWRPGRSPLEKRLHVGSVVRKSERMTKPRVVEQILRLLWDLSIAAEEQNVGELEMKLKNWELAYLFDLKWNPTDPGSMAMYEGVIDSPLLLRSCKLQPYRPSGHLRITGRRQDAEHIAEKLERRLPRVSRLTVNLDSFSPMLGTPGWPKTLDKLFRDDDRVYIQEQTLTVIEQPRPELLHIHGHAKRSRYVARRLLFALLELPTPGLTRLLPHTVGADNINAKKEGEAVLMPQSAGPALGLRHRKLDLARLILPVKRLLPSEHHEHKKGNAESASAASASAICESVTQQLGEVELPRMPTYIEKGHTYWDTCETQTGPWKAHLCRVLHSISDSDNKQSLRSRKRKQGSSDHALTVVEAQVPRVDRLLSFFEPRQDLGQEQMSQRTGALIVARLVPSPFTPRGMNAVKFLPPVELAYRIVKDERGNPDIRLLRAQAYLQHQDVRVPLPESAVDLCFERSTTMRARGYKLQNTEHIKAFTEALRTSLQGAKTARLSAKSEVLIKLPADMVRVAQPEQTPTEGALEKGAEGVEVEYLFAGFEHRRKEEYQALTPEALPKNLDPETREVLSSFGDRMFLQLREVSAGIAGGRRTEVVLHYSPSKEERRDLTNATHEVGDGAPDPAVDSEALDQSNRASNASKSRRLQDVQAIVRTAVGVARLFTRLNVGEVQPMLDHQRARAGWEDEQEEVESDDGGVPENEETAAGVDEHGKSHGSEAV